MSELPVPDNAAILHDPRESEECRRTSIPSEHVSSFNPNGLRLWTREEDLMATSQNPVVKQGFKDGMLDHHRMYRIYNLIVGEPVSKGSKGLNFTENPPLLSIIQIPKTGSTSLKTMFQPYLRADHEMFPQINLSKLTITTIRHPISRLISGIGTLKARTWVCNQSRSVHSKTKEVCNDVKESTKHLGDTKNLNMAARKALAFLTKWSVWPVYSLHAFDYWNHITSQMFFVNTYPPGHLFPQGVPPASFFSVDALVRMERMDEGFAATKKAFPEIADLFPAEVQKRNSKEGRKSSGGGLRMSCDVAWEIYDYFYQDFVCLGYEMPAECLKSECKPSGRNRLLAEQKVN